MKKLIISLIAASTALGAMDFIPRFGPNSPAYNQPLYFEAKHMISRPDKKKEKKSRKYRDRIRKKQYPQSKRRLRTVTAQDLE